MRTADQILAGLVPPAQLSARRHDERLPLAAMLLPTLSDGSFIYTIARVDDSGAVSAAHVLDCLGWRTGDRLDVKTVRNVVVLQRRRAGLHAVPKKRALVIPAAARRACGIQTGDSLMLAADAELETVLIHPPAVLDKMMALYHEVLGND